MYEYIALGLLAIAFWQKKLWVFLASGLAWIGLGIFGLIKSPTNSIEYFFGWAFIALSLMCFTSLFWLKEKDEV
jgi:hypothetical protein